MQIGYVPNPREWSRWGEAEALLEPARALADYDMEILGHNHLLWAVMDGDELLAVATARLTEDGRCEVPLIGGRDHKRWLKQLDDKIGAAARDAGATRLVALGRRGWARTLRAHGWDCFRWDAETNIYSRDLRTEGESAISECGPKAI